MPVIDAATDESIREMFDLPADGDLFERLCDWDQDRVVMQVRLKNAVHNVMAEQLYENGKKDDGVAVHFLMRLSMLAHEAGLRGYGKQNPCVKEAIAVLGDPGQPNTTETVGAPIYERQCRPGPPTFDETV
jgi:hypothetical protein